LKIHQLLGLSGILKPSEAVVTPFVRQTVSIHLTGKPLPTIDADLDTEGKPRLNASIHEAKDGVCEVVVKMQTLALTMNQFQPLHLSISKIIEIVARFHRSQNADQTFRDSIRFGYFAGCFFLIRVFRPPS